MNQIRELIRRLSWTQRITLLTVALGIVGGLYWFSVWNQERGFKPLLTGLAAADAGAVTAKLKELGVEYRLKDEGSTILVRDERIAETRLQLASEGLPKSGRIGFELFDKANFGASEFTEQVNYQRAVEGELERSVMSIREVEAARVHVTPAKDSLYTESRQPAKASVLVKLHRGATLTPQNVAAVSQLAASAVPGLSADQVSVLDTNGNLLGKPKLRGPGDGTESSEAALEYRKNVEREIVSKVAATLEPLLGADHFRAAASAEVDLTSGEQSEETYDPQKSVIINSQKSDDGPVLPNSSGVPGTAANIPNPTATRSTGASTTNYSRHTENVSYQSSRVVTHTKLPQGAVKKLSLSVLVDHTLRWNGKNKVIEPPPPEKLKVIRDLVTAATGLNMERGDQLVVEAFPFESTLNAEPLEPAPPEQPTANNNVPAWLQRLMGLKNFPLLAALGASAAVLLMAGGVFYAIRSRGKKHMAVQAAAALAAKANEPGAGTQQIEAAIAENAAESARREAEALKSLKGQNPTTKKTEVLTKHIATEAKENPSGLAHVVRSWLSGEYQR